MKRLALAALLAALTAAVVSPVTAVRPAGAQNAFMTPGNETAVGHVNMCLNGSGLAVVCWQTQIQGNGTGTTGAVVGTLTPATGKWAYICGFTVSAVGSGAVGPITIAGLVTAAQVYQATAAATGGVVAQATFTPCIQASAVSTNITVTTTADGSATAVDVNSWGYYQ